MQKVVHLLRSARFIEQRKLQFLVPILLTAFLMLFNQPVQSQNLSAKKVTLNLQGVPVKEALMAVQKQSGITFVFSEDIKKYTVIKVTLTEKNITVKQAIELILKTTNLKYTQVDDQVVIDEKPAPKSPNVLAGGGPGTLKGRIVEFESSQPLPGASVYIVELQKGMQSNIDGYYNFSNIPAGKYTLRVSFVGFTNENVQVELHSGKEETYDVKLHGSNSLKEVIVSGTKKTRAPVAHTSEKQLIAEIKNAQSVVSGISSEQISKGPDRNVAEVVRRISGISVKDDKFIVIRGMDERYNLTYLNGNVAPSTELYSRSFALDLIPSRIIDQILIYKSPAPDLLGDMTGGAVKIFTKDAKSVKHLDVEFQLGDRAGTTFGKNFLTYQGGKFDFLGFDDGTRKLPSVVPGFGNFTQANISQKQYVQAFSPILQYGQETALPNVQLTVNYYNSFLNNTGHILSDLTSFSYKHEYQQSEIYKQQGLTGDVQGGSNDKIYFDNQNTETAQLNLLQNFIYHLKDSSKVEFKNFLLQQGQNITAVNTSFPNAFPNPSQVIKSPAQYSQIGSNKDNILSYSQRFLYAGNLGGTNYWDTGKQKLEWNTGYTYSRQDIPDQRIIHLVQGGSNSTPFAGDYDENWTSPIRVSNDPNANYNLLTYGAISRIWIRNTENVYNGSIDYSYKPKSWITFKAGTYQQWRERQLYRKVFLVNEGDNIDNPNVSSGSSGNYVDWELIRFKEQDLGNVWSNTYLRDDPSALKVYDRTSGNDAYVGTEQNNSGYVAASLLPFNGKLDIYGGLRVEYDRQKVAGALGAVGYGDLNTPVLADHKQTVWLPSLNISYRPTASYVIRAAYGKTVNRPDFREVSPYQDIDYINNQIITGNPALKSATISNYEIRWEWYPQQGNKGEAISIGGFYKDLQNPIERILQATREAGDITPTQISFQNAGSATVKGIEIELRKGLDFIPVGVFRNIEAIANVSFMQSNVKLDSAQLVQDLANNPGLGSIRNLLHPISRALQGQAPYIINAGLYYDDAGRGTKIALIYNVTGPRIYAASPYGGTDPNIKGPAFRGSQFELPTQQLDFTLIQRIVKTLQIKLSVQNLLNKPIQMAEDYNFTYKYEKGQDNISSTYNPGRYYLLSLTYSF